jgi:hypothetical protein
MPATAIPPAPVSIQALSEVESRRASVAVKVQKTPFLANTWRLTSVRDSAHFIDISLTIAVPYVRRSHTLIIVTLHDFA